MKTIIKALVAAAMAVLCVAAAAQQSASQQTASQQTYPSDKVPLGAVEAVYVRIAPGLFIETRLVREKQHTETWSDVRVRHAGPGKPRNEIAKNPEGMTLQPGDVVQLTIAVLPEFATGPVQEVTRITERVAPAGSTYARRFQQQTAPAVTLAEQLRM